MRSKDSNAGLGGASKTYGFIGHKTCRAGSAAVAIMSQAAWDGAGAFVRCRAEPMRVVAPLWSHHRG
jgi:hypothetical protein